MLLANTVPLLYPELMNNWKQQLSDLEVKYSLINRSQRQMAVVGILVALEVRFVAGASWHYATTERITIVAPQGIQV
jgi:hypothetical protein